MISENKFKELCGQLFEAIERRNGYLVTFNGLGQHLILDIITKEVVDVSISSALSNSHFPSEYGVEVHDDALLPFDKSFYWFANISSDEESIYLALCQSHVPIDKDALILFYKLSWLSQRFISSLLTERLNSANAWIDSELEDIGEIQASLLPDATRQINGIEYAYSYKAMKSAGGDYIDIINFSQYEDYLKPDNFGLIVADVTGHGVAASVEAAMLDAILRTYRPTDQAIKPSEVINYINRHFFTRNDRGRFITVNIFRYFADTSTLYYANAGHPPAYIVRGDELIKLDRGGIPLGVMRDNYWESYTCKIEPDDMLFIYTDAVIEARNPYDETFEFERLEYLLKSNAGKPKALIDNIYQQLCQHTLSDKFDDDLTMCAVKFK